MPPIAVLVALADPTRCRIVEILRQGAQPVHVLAGSFDISRPAISRHLRVLKQARLISEKKAGRENRYALHADKLKPVSAWLEALQTPRNSEAAPKAAKAPKAKKPTPPRVVKPVTPKAKHTPEPVVEVMLAPAAPKPRREAPISQMGFDF